MKLKLMVLFFVIPFLLVGEISIIYTANRQGEIEPCGCQINQMGGLNRMAEFLKRMKPKAHIIIDVGDTFCKSAALDTERMEIEKLKAKVIAKAYGLMGLSYFSPGEKDFAFGMDFLRELGKLTKATFLSANLVDIYGHHIYKSLDIVSIRGQKIGLIGVVNGKEFSDTPFIVAEPYLERLRTVIEEGKRMGVNHFFLLSHLGFERDKMIAEEKIVDVIFGSHDDYPTEEIYRSGKTILLSMDIDGKQIGHLKYNLKDPMASEYNLVKLDKTFESKNEVWNLMRKYDESVKQISLRSHEKGSKGGVGYVANPHSCQGCHGEQYRFWEGTNHASAYLVLYSKNKHFDPSCVGCHSIGFMEKEGFSSITRPISLNFQKDILESEPWIEKLMGNIFDADETRPLDSRLEPDRYRKLKKRYHQALNGLNKNNTIKSNFLGVQCEHCHGNRVGHPSISSNHRMKVKVEEKTCLKCHFPPHDIDFNFNKKVTSVACPLMGDQP